jgi:hypothetical protein
MNRDSRFLRQWEAYQESPAIYPVVDDKASKLTFDNDPRFKRPVLSLE